MLLVVCVVRLNFCSLGLLNVLGLQLGMKDLPAGPVPPVAVVCDWLMFFLSVDSWRKN